MNIGGIAIAVAAFYVLMSIVDREVTFNHGIDGYQNIYQMTHQLAGEQANYMCRPIAEAVAERLPSVEKFGCLGPWAEYEYYTQNDGTLHKINMRSGWASMGLLDVFGIKIVEGDTAKFSDESKIIVSKKNAEKFGIKIGDILRLNPQMPDYVEVVAIYEDLAPNSEFARYGAFKRLNQMSMDSPSQWNYIYYLKMYENAPAPLPTDEFRQTLYKIIKEIYKAQGEEGEFFEQQIGRFGMELVPLADLHFHDEIQGYHVRTDKELIYTMSILAIVIVAIAFINYLNFFFARVPIRLKSINTRKVLGCGRGALVMMLVMESAVFALIASALAYLIVVLIMPSLTEGIVNFDEWVLSNHKMLIITVLVAVLTASAISLYPAFYITSIPAALALKGGVTQGRDGKLRHVLIGFQVTASIVLIIGTLFIQKNNSYLMNRELGFDRDCLLSTYTSNKLADSPATVREKLIQNTDILDVAWSDGQLVAAQRMSWARPNPENQEETMYIDVFPVSWNFLDFMGIKVIEGRNFTEADSESEDGVIIFNESAKKAYNLTLETKYNGHSAKPCDLAGFCADFNFKPLQYGITPFAFYVFGKEKWQPMTHLYVRIAKGADVAATVEYVNKRLAEIDPDFELMEQEIITFDKEVSQNYQSQSTLARMITIFTVMAILISVMGIFGIVLFEAERRRKEIGIRKVNGATVAEILLMFNHKFLILTAICSALAIPVAYLAVSKYLSSYTYHYPMSVWIFLAAIVLAALVVALVVSSASFKAANENPVKTLKTE